MPKLSMQLSRPVDLVGYSSDKKELLKKFFCITFSAEEI